MILEFTQSFCPDVLAAVPGVGDGGSNHCQSLRAASWPLSLKGQQPHALRVSHSALVSAVCLGEKQRTERGSEDDLCEEPLWCPSVGRTLGGLWILTTYYGNPSPHCFQSWGDLSTNHTTGIAHARRAWRCDILLGASQRHQVEGNTPAMVRTK